MSNKPHRRSRGRIIGRDSEGRTIIEPGSMFPTSTPLNATFEQLVADGLRERIRNDPHRVDLIELGFNTYEVNCSCGFVAPAPFGLGQATRIKDNHLFRMGRGLDPLGAKYA